MRREGSRIVAIGKDLTEYDALDTGVFVCSPLLFHALDVSIAQGDTTAGMTLLELSCAWAAGAKGVDSVLLGPATVQHLEDGVRVLAGDCVDLYENWAGDDGCRPGVGPPAGPSPFASFSDSKI